MRPLGGVALRELQSGEEVLDLGVDDPVRVGDLAAQGLGTAEERTGEAVEGEDGGEDRPRGRRRDDEGDDQVGRGDREPDRHMQEVPEGGADAADIPGEHMAEVRFAAGGEEPPGRRRQRPVEPLAQAVHRPEPRPREDRLPLPGRRGAHGDQPDEEAEGDREGEGDTDPFQRGHQRLVEGASGLPAAEAGGVEERDQREEAEPFRDVPGEEQQRRERGGPRPVGDQFGEERAHAGKPASPRRPRRPRRAPGPFAARPAALPLRPPLPALRRERHPVGARGHGGLRQSGRCSRVRFLGASAVQRTSSSMRTPPYGASASTTPQSTAARSSAPFSPNSRSRDSMK